MTPETDLDLDSCLKLSKRKVFNERILWRVRYTYEATIEPVVEMAHRMTDLKLTVHDISEYITTTEASFFLCNWSKNMSRLRRFRVAIKSDLKWIEQRSNHQYAPSFLRYVLTALASDRFAQILLGGERLRERYKEEIWDGVLLPSEHSQDPITDVAVAAVLHLLAFVFQYLIGYTDRGGSKTYSSGCLDFRDSFVSLLLFHGAYVWIKFRQPATGKRKPTGTQSGGDRSKVYARASKNGSATKYEARYNIPTDSLDEDHPVKCPRLSLGLHESDVEAWFVSRVARSFYEVDQGEACCVEIQGVQHKFSVPAMSEQEQELVGEEKRQRVISKAKQVGKQKYAEFRKEQLAMATDTAGSSDPSLSSSLIHQPSADEPLDAPSHLGPHEETARETGLQFRSLEDPVGFEQQWPWESPPVVSTLTENEDFEAMWAVLDLYPAPQKESTPDRNIPYSGSARFDSIIESVPQESVLAQEQYSWGVEYSQVPEPQQVYRPLQAQIEVKENESIHQRYEGLLKDYERLRQENELLKSVIVTLVAGKTTNARMCIQL